MNHNSTAAEVVGNPSLAPEKAVEPNQTVPASDSNATSNNNISLDRIEGRNIAPVSVGNDILDSSLSNTSDALQPSDSPSSMDKDATNALQKTSIPEFLKTDLAPSVNYSSRNAIPKVKDSPEDAVASLSKMNDMLLQSLTSYHSMRPWWSKGTDQELILARSLIENAPSVQNDPKLNQFAPLYRNFSMFRRSYELMEQTLKVYIYKEGERPIFHQPVLQGIYASEGWFMKLLKSSKHFVTKNPKKAHLFYLPFSTRMLEETLYVPNSHSRKNLIQCLRNYLSLITSRYSFWNRTGGADHFVVACHDWAPAETRKIMAHCIRALCNSDIKEGFQFGKDVSLAETYVRLPQHPLRQVGGRPPSKRKILAFFAGNMHGYLRPILLEHWENKDPDMKIFGPLPKVKGQMSYIQHMQSSKYCICARGYEVNSPRVVEAIFYECVPVIISDNFVPPFFETLKWESFAIFVPEKDIPNLKNILLSIPEKRYRKMQKRVKLVQQHFLWHPRPVKYDIFHMILHSIWYTRVFQISSK
ncbi:probable glycosyltransferase At5g03795 [Coffea arabica]|uniref:Probable glycosyltransferase At5g03795 n=2 Tax=Coffea TaxID=13442 RepID=A0ABM4VBM7_COFAR